MANSPERQINNEPRVVRIFVSSTFRDMQADREELIKRVFPRLRKLCAQRGVAWSEVDLRWGITEEQSQRGVTIPICLGEIDHCLPFFLCLLGERYGWVPGPENIPTELRLQFPWLDQHLHHSVTEMEIWHAILNHPDRPAHAFFYFRDPAYLERLPEGAKIEDYHSENDTSRQKMTALKDKIRHSGCQVSESYRDALDLDERAHADLTALLDRLFPPGSEPEPLDREASEHEAFARSRLGVYIGRPEYGQQLDAFARTPTDPTTVVGQGVGLVVCGASGAGKSALLANWLFDYRAAHPEEVVLYHAIGATPQSADGLAMLRRFLGEFRRRLGVQVEVPDQPIELQRAFAGAMYKAAARGKIVLVLDGLNQLEDRDGMPDLVWLPPELPTNMRLVVATLPGRALEELTKRRWPTLEVKPLEPAERTRLIVACLQQASKSLSDARVRRIASAEQAANPLFLRAMLEELRVFGSHEALDERIAYYLATPSLEELFARILERYEADYERDQPGLVGEAMTLLWAARRGLTEEELLQLLGNVAEGRPLPQAYWSPLFLAAEHALTNRAGRIGFVHEYMRQAVARRYLPQQEQRRTAHQRLAGYFAAHDDGGRKVDELPWQLSQAGAWGALYSLLTNLDFFERAWEANKYELKVYLAQIEQKSPHRILEGFRSVLDHPAENVTYLWRVAALLADTGYLLEALSLREFQVEYNRQLGNLDGLANSLGEQALLLQDRGELDRAMCLHKDEERLYRQLGDLNGLAVSLGNQASIRQVRGDLDGAMALHQEAERLTRQLGDLNGLAVILNNQALILSGRGNLDGAMALHQEAERLERQFGDLNGLAGSLGNQASILQARGDLDGAMAVHNEVVRLYGQCGNLNGLASILGNQGLILKMRGELDEAMALLKEQERLCRQLGNLNGLQRSLNNQAGLFEIRGEVDGAMALYKEAGRLCLQLGNLDDLASSLGSQGLILKTHGDPDRAMSLFREAERLRRQLGNLDGLARMLGEQARILETRDDMDGAMALYEEAEHLFRQVGNLDGLRISLGDLASILEMRGDLDEAVALHKEKECLCRQLGDLKDLATTLNSQAFILQACGDLDGAMALHQEAQRLFRQLGDPERLAISLAGQAELLGLDQGQPEMALPFLEEALGLAIQNGLESLANTIRSLQEQLGN